MRPIWPVMMSILALMGCREDSPRPTAGEEVAVLDVVVDSLPFVIEETWGQEDGPYTALLDIRAPTTRLSDRLSEQSAVERSDERHPAPWVERQRSKAHVVGSCIGGSDDASCDLGQATVLATISRVRLTDDGEATVEVALGRPGFATVLELTLSGVAGTWSVVDYRVFVIS